MNKSVLFDQFPELQSKSLLLRKMIHTDSDDLFEMISNIEIYKYNAGIPQRNCQVRGLIQLFVPNVDSGTAN